jgi:hypothetical protein
MSRRASKRLFQRNRICGVALFARADAKSQVRKLLADLAATISKAKAGGRRLVLALAEHHGLTITMLDADTMSIRLQLAEGMTVEFETRLPGDKIIEWLHEQQGKHSCIVCGKPNRSAATALLAGHPKAPSRMLRTRAGPTTKGGSDLLVANPPERLRCWES